MSIDLHVTTTRLLQIPPRHMLLPTLGVVAGGLAGRGAVVVPVGQVLRRRDRMNYASDLQRQQGTGRWPE